MGSPADDELKQLKSRLRSLVVSSPSQMDACGLARDYRLMMGEPLPAARHGYRDYITFLQEKCADCFLFSGPAFNPVLTLIVPDSLKHIDGFVQRQKIPSSAKLKGKGKRRSVPEYMVKPKETTNYSNGTTSINNNTYYYKPTSTSSKLPETPTKQPNIAVYKPPSTTYKPPSTVYKPPTTTYQPRSTTYQPPSSTYQPQSTTYKQPTPTYKPPSTTYKPPSNTSSQQVPDSQALEHNANFSQNSWRVQEPEAQNTVIQSMNNLNIQDSAERNQSLTTTATSQTAVQKFLQKRLQASTQHLEADIKDDDSGRQTLSSGGLSSKQALLDDLRLEMKVLIAAHPKGIWSADLMRTYKSRFGRELPLSRVGYSNVVSLTRALAGVLRVARPETTGDWLLLPAAAPDPPALPAAPVGPARLPLPAPQYDPDDALPGAPFEASVFPADCVHFVESIPALPLPPLPPPPAPAPALRVVVGEVYSPSHLWLLRLGSQYHDAMERVMDEMNDYYASGAGRDRVLEAGAVRLGHYCAAPFEGDWHRAIIVKLLDCDTVKVRYIDYGTVSRVTVASLRPLRREWGALPAQATRARLAGVRPVARGRRWPHAAARDLLQRVSQRELVAQLVAIDLEESIMEVYLVDTTGEEDVCINDALVAAGHADARHDSALASAEPHQLPSFTALEVGSTPNLADIERYLAAGLQPRYVHDYRRHVPSDAPPPPLPHEDEACLPRLEVEVYRALAAQSPALAVRQLATRIAEGAVRLPPHEHAVFTRLLAADPSGLAAHRYLTLRLPTPDPPRDERPTLNPQAPEFRSLQY